MHLVYLMLRFLSILTIVTLVISNWAIFEKTGISGWKSLVPFYSYYTLVTKVAGKSQIYFWVSILSVFAILCLPFIYIGLALFKSALDDGSGMMDVNIVVSILYFPLIIFFFVITADLFTAIAKNFGKDLGFEGGLTILYIPFYLALAFGDYKFLPPKEKDNSGKIDQEKEYDDEDVEI